MLLLRLNLTKYLFQTNNVSPPSLEFRSNLYSVKFTLGKPSSIFVSEAINTSEFVFKCANTALPGFLVWNAFRNLLQSVVLSVSSYSSESHTSDCLLKLCTFCQLKTFANSFTEILLNSFVPFWFKCNFPLFKWFLTWGLILAEWSII